MLRSLIGSHAIIKSRKHDPIAVGLIIDTTDKIITIRTFDDIYYLDSNVEISIKSFSNEFCLCEGTIAAIEDKMLHISNLNVLSRNERRRADRIDFQSDMIFVSDIIREDIIGRIHNISTSGLLFETNVILPRYDTINMQFPIKTKNRTDIFNAKAQIVRLDKNFYGCAFTDISTYNHEKINNIVKEKIKVPFFKKTYYNKRR